MRVSTWQIRILHVMERCSTLCAVAALYPSIATNRLQTRTTRDVKKEVDRWQAYLDVPDPDALAAEFSSRCSSRGRDISCLIPPARILTSGITAWGSYLG